MSMLAERKQKQRWFLNPRANKEWAQDANKFGQRMLEKMGWSAGKGLGANEDGITDHIKVKYKNDVQGMGYQLRDDQWTQHENNFTQLLANLGSNTEATKLDHLKSEKSLEKKSQTSRARVHYHKFTRGKDLAARSEKDLANIFGRKTLENPVKVEVKEEADNEEAETKAFGVVTIKSGNMTEYFKSKFSKLGDKFSSAKNNKTEDGDESESEIGDTAGFGFGSGNKKNNRENFMNFVSNSKTNEKDDESESDVGATAGFGFSSKGNDIKQSFVSFVSSSTQKEDQNTGVKRKRDEIEYENLPKDKTKKKNKKKKNVAFENKGNDINIDEEICYDNPCLNQEDSIEEHNTEENGLDNPAFNPNDESDKKKIKSVTFASPLAEYTTISEDSPEKKKKKKKKHQLGIDNPACEEQSLEEAPLEPENEKTSYKRKRKSTNNVDDQESTPVKKSKGKKYIEAGIENLACEEIDSNETSLNTLSEETTKSKKKKKSIENNQEDIIFDEISTPKKNKKKKRSSDNGIANLACEELPLNCVDNLGCSINLVEEGIESITNAIDNYQSELENEMNLKKYNKMQKSRKFKNKPSGNANDTH